jgi:hypothetical protein
LDLRRKKWQKAGEDCIMKNFVNVKIKEDVIGGICCTQGRDKNAYNIYVGKAEGKRRLGSHRRRLEDNIRIYLRETGREVVDWMHLARDMDQWQDHVIKVTNLWVA